MILYTHVIACHRVYSVIDKYVLTRNVLSLTLFTFRFVSRVRVANVYTPRKVKYAGGQFEHEQQVGIGRSRAAARSVRRDSLSARNETTMASAERYAARRGRGKSKR